MAMTAAKFPVMMHMHFSPGDEGLMFCVEDWGRDENHGYKTISASNGIGMAEAAFDVAVSQRPDRIIYLRQGARVMRRHPERGKE